MTAGIVPILSTQQNITIVGEQAVIRGGKTHNGQPEGWPLSLE
jgi:hypothetical protein